MRGQVFEVANPDDPRAAWKRVPSSNAFVLVTWVGTVPQPAHAGSVCLHASIARTDEGGRFDVPGWWTLPKLYPVIDRRTVATAYKPGLEAVDFPGHPGSETDITLARSGRSAEGRLTQLSMFSEPGCSETKEIQDVEGVLRPYYQALVGEVQQLGLPGNASKHVLDKLQRKLTPAPVAEPPMRIKAQGTGKVQGIAVPAEEKVKE